MSTILDALKKVERDRQKGTVAVPDRLLATETAPPRRRRRWFATALALGLGATVGSAAVLVALRVWPPADTTREPAVAAEPRQSPPAQRLPTSETPAMAAAEGTGEAEKEPPPQDRVAALPRTPEEMIEPPPATPDVRPRATPEPVPAPIDTSRPDLPPEAIPAAPAEVAAVAPTEPSPPPPPESGSRPTAEPTVGSIAAPRPDLPPAPTPAPPAEVATVPAEPPAPAPEAEAAEEEVAPVTPWGAPRVSVNFVQWSADRKRRYALVRVAGGGLTRVREGDDVGTLTVDRIRPDAILFRFRGEPYKVSTQR